jgi:hypothetical protein
LGVMVVTTPHRRRSFLSQLAAGRLAAREEYEDQS